MSIEKGRFENSDDYQRAIAESEFRSIKPIDSKVANRCKSEEPGVHNLDSSLSMGVCGLEDNGCTYRVDKISGVSGFCLKNIVGTVDRKEIQKNTGENTEPFHNYRQISQ